MFRKVGFEGYPSSLPYSPFDSWDQVPVEKVEVSDEVILLLRYREMIQVSDMGSNPDALRFGQLTGFIEPHPGDVDRLHIETMLRKKDRILSFTRGNIQSPSFGQEMEISFQEGVRFRSQGVFLPPEFFIPAFLI